MRRPARGAMARSGRVWRMDAKRSTNTARAVRDAAPSFYTRRFAVAGVGDRSTVPRAPREALR
jgi:hypothetical protein